VYLAAQNVVSENNRIKNIFPNEGFCLLIYNSVYFVENHTIRKNMLPSISGSENKQSQWRTL
jgi:hypothetical protein